MGKHKAPGCRRGPFRYAHNFRTPFAIALAPQTPTAAATHHWPTSAKQVAPTSPHAPQNKATAASIVFISSPSFGPA